MHNPEARIAGRILIVDGKNLIGGGQRMLPLIAHAFIANQPVVIRPYASGEQAELKDVQVEKLHFPTYPSGLSRPGTMLKVLPQVLATAWRLRRCIQKNQIKTIIANDLYSLIPLLPAVAGLKIPIFFYAHSCDLPAAAANLLARCRGVIACSQAAALALPVISTNVRVVYNAVDIPPMPVNEKGTPPKNSWVIGYAGRVDPNKNLTGLIHAFAQALSLLNRNKGPTTLEILGSGEISHLEELKQLVKHLGLESSVRWLGWSEHPLPVMSQWDAVLLASHSEALPLCLIEGQMLGKLVLGTNRGGIAEIITDGSSGILSASPHISDLKSALIRLSTTDLTVAREGQRQAHLRFTPTVHSHSLRRAVNEMLAGESL